MTDRAQKIADARALLDWLDANPDVPLTSNDIIQASYFVTNESDHTDESGEARIRALVEQIGGEYELSSGTHHYARRRFGTAAYQASYITSQAYADHNERERLGREALAARAEGGEDR